MKQKYTSETSGLITEQEDSRFEGVDQMNAFELATLMNENDARVSEAVANALPQIATAIDEVAKRLISGGRLIYVGAGTSGRIATLDASEIYPTFGVTGRVIPVMAGGQSALVNPAEGAEDDVFAGSQDLKSLDLTPKDSLIGVASSGSTPYVLAAMSEAREAGAFVAALVCNENSKMSAIADVAIEVIVGPEFLTGSTRLKAGTAQKMVLNMISTITMMKAGKTYRNLMVDVVASNSKLKQRAIRMLKTIEKCSDEIAEAALEKNSWNVKGAVLSLRFSLTPQEANERLEKSGGYLAVALGETE